MKQVLVHDDLHRLLKIEAAKRGCDIGELSSALIYHAMVSLKFEGVANEELKVLDQRLLEFDENAPATH